MATWCVTCGNPVENGQCGCWGNLAAALQRFLGRDFDASAEEAARLWGELDEKDKAYIWSAGYAEQHDVTTYPAPESLRGQDKRDYPHDEDCPRCGRRQWGGPDPYETCQSCGYAWD